MCRQGTISSTGHHHIVRTKREVYYDDRAKKNDNFDYLSKSMAHIERSSRNLGGPVAPLNR